MKENFWREMGLDEGRVDYLNNPIKKLVKSFTSRVDHVEGRIAGLEGR